MTAPTSLVELKVRYLRLTAKLFATNAETYWQQGKLLIQIKAQLKHGGWLQWVEKNLNVAPRQAQYRLQVGSLPSLPKYAGNRVFVLENLAAIAVIAKQKQLSPEAAVEHWERTHPADWERAFRKGDGSPPPGPRPKSGSTNRPPPQNAKEGMTCARAFLILGIDTYAMTITEESLNILMRGLRQIHHPDKGGSHSKFISITEAVKILGGRPQ
jgi:hypothetical protein